jgi:cytidine deaminase
MADLQEWSKKVIFNKFWFSVLLFIVSVSLSAAELHRDRHPRVLQESHPEVTSYLKKKLPKNPFFIPGKQAKELAKELKLSMDQLMVELIPVAQDYARPEISHYRVGVVGRVKRSGDLLLGVNLEFSGLSLNLTVHGEQFVVARALSLGMGELESLALSAAPCGHCRQWLSELEAGTRIRLLIPNQSVHRLMTRLPAAFGPADLSVGTALLSDKSSPLVINADGKDPQSVAVEAASKAYAPYTHALSGVALEMKSGKVISGTYIENAAFNPSLSPLLCALVNLVAVGEEYSQINHVFLAESGAAPDSLSQQPLAEILLQRIAKGATPLITVPLEASK